jgi:hypothetical protein
VPCADREQYDVGTSTRSTVFAAILVYEAVAWTFF